MTNPNLPAETKGIYLGGGLPGALCKAAFAEAAPCGQTIRHFIEAGGTVYAECGGLMYLTEM